MPALNKGQRFAGRYVLKSRLGSSEDADVWLAQDTDALVPVVLKIARGDAARARRLLEHEFTTGRRFNHPSIVRYYDFGETEDGVYLTQEYLPDGDLGAWLERPWTRVLPCVAQVCDALAHVHQRGYVHRDVKLRNVMLTDHGRAKLIDFGIASPTGEGGLRSGGSPRSSSPQQRAGEPPSPSDDVWSVGAMLYELLSGTAPSAGAIPTAAPPALRERIAQMLDPDPAQRPADLALLAREFEKLLDVDGNVTVPPEEFERPAEVRALPRETITPESFPRAASSSPLPPTRQPSRRGVSPLVGIAAIALLLGAAAAVFYLLPGFVTDAPPASGTVASTPARAPTPGATRAEPAVEPWKLAQRARLREQAETRLEALLEKQFELDDKKVDIWAPEEYASARAAAIDGDRAFRDNDYARALELYAQGDEVLAELVDRAATLIETSIASARAAIEAGDGAAAAERFELVLQIEPDNAAAAAGKARAERLADVIALVEQGREFERLSEYQQALGAYRDARDLDGQWSAARDGVERMNRRLAGARFEAAMTEGFAALARDRYAEASAAFERAERIRGGTAEVREARAQLAQRRRSADIVTLREQAAALEAEARFDAALERYRDALKMDPTVSFALDGVRRIEGIEALDQRLDELLAEPDRLSSDSVYDTAKDVLRDARQVERPWPGLSDKIARLQSLMRASRTTTVVRLVSDNLTDVLVYRVGRLGRFEQTSLELRPGTYTVVGSREGFRDFRRDFRIGPELEAPLIEVRCDERI